MSVIDKRMVNELMNVIDTCNPWEQEFVPSLQEAIEKGWQLSAKRKAKLKEIYDQRVLGKGRRDAKNSSQGKYEGENVRAILLDGAYHIQDVKTKRILNTAIAPSDTLAIFTYMEEAWAELEPREEPLPEESAPEPTTEDEVIVPPGSNSEEDSNEGDDEDMPF